MACLVLFLSLFFSPGLFASSLTDTTRITVTRLNDFFQFYGKEFFNYSYGKRALRISSDHNLRFYDIHDDMDKQKLENSLNAQFRHRFSNHVFGIEYSSSSLQDRMSGIRNDYEKYGAGLFLSSDNDRKRISAGVGSESRQNIRDQGWYVNAVYADPEQPAAFNPRARIQYEQHEKRKNFSYDLGFRNRNMIGDYARNDLKTLYRETGRDYYINSDRNREKRLNINRRITNDILLNLPNDWIFNHRINFSSDLERLKYDQGQGGGKRDKDRFYLDNDFRVRKNLGAIYLSGEAALTQEQNNYSSDRENFSNPVDYSVLKKNLRTKAVMPFSIADSAFVSYQVSLYQFTTPDSQNYDDRDEYSRTFIMAFSNSPSRQLRFYFSARVHSRHLMYISGRRSAQNHVNRIYSINLGQSLNLDDKFRLSGSQRIFANYYIYDFESLYPINYSSMLFRGIRLRESLNYSFLMPFSLNLSGEIRLEEDGYVDWKKFVQQTTIERNYLRWNFSLEFRHRNIFIRLGPYWHYRRDERVLNNRKDLILEPARMGWQLDAGKGNLLLLQYSIEEQNNSGIFERRQHQGRLMINFSF